jgi:hypothetical protein
MATVYRFLLDDEKGDRIGLYITLPVLLESRQSTLERLMLDARCPMPDARHSAPNARHSTLDV